MACNKNQTLARELQREYLRTWRKNNKDKVKSYNEAYWARKADAELARREKQGGERSGDKTSGT